jgi:hypothetical protein
MSKKDQIRVATLEPQADFLALTQEQREIPLWSWCWLGSANSYKNKIKIFLDIPPASSHPNLLSISLSAIQKYLNFFFISQKNEKSRE